MQYVCKAFSPARAYTGLKQDHGPGSGAKQSIQNKLGFANMIYKSVQPENMGV